MKDERERALARQRQRERRSTPEGWSYLALKNCRTKAGRWGLDFNLTEEDVQLPSHCPVLGIPLILGLIGKSTRHRQNAPSLDRIDNTRGYVKGNVRVISLRANILKRDATLAELEALVAYVRGER